MSTTSRYPMVEPASVAEWHAWLSANAETSGRIRLALQKKGSSHQGISYLEALDEALAFGWIDSTAGALDSDRFTVTFARRKPGSTWSQHNKISVKRLQAEGRMMPAGRAAVEAAKADGSWNLLDSIDRLELPTDLSDALDYAEVRAGWDALSESVRRQLLWQIANAKRPETRVNRIGIIVATAHAKMDGAAG